MILIGSTLWSIMAAACGMTNSFALLLAARMGVGLGEASLSPAVFAMLPDYFPKHRLGAAMAAYLTIGRVAINCFASADAAVPLSARPWIPWMIAASRNMLNAI